MREETVSRRGVYYDLNKSPYEYLTPYGGLFKFRSKKRLSMYIREIEKETMRADAFLFRNNMCEFVSEPALKAIYKAVYLAVYRKIEG